MDFVGRVRKVQHKTRLLPTKSFPLFERKSLHACMLEFSTTNPVIKNYNWFIRTFPRNFNLAVIFFKGQWPKWKFACYTLTTVNMGQKTTIYPKTSPRAPSVRALESNWILFSGNLTASQNYADPLILVSFWLKLKSLFIFLFENTKFDNFNDHLVKIYSDLKTFSATAIFKINAWVRYQKKASKKSNHISCSTFGNFDLPGG